MSRNRLHWTHILSMPQAERHSGGSKTIHTRRDKHTHQLKRKGSALWSYPSRTPRSSSDEQKKKNLSCARWKLKGFSHRSFSVLAPLVWNNLPPHIRHSSSLSQFKTSLKTFLFTSAFSELPWSPGRLFVCFVFMDCCCLRCWPVSEREREGEWVMGGEMEWGRERGETERGREGLS